MKINLSRNSRKNYINQRVIICKSYENLNKSLNKQFQEIFDGTLTSRKMVKPSISRADFWSLLVWSLGEQTATLLSSYSNHSQSFNFEALETITVENMQDLSHQNNNFEHRGHTKIYNQKANSNRCSSND